MFENSTIGRTKSIPLSKISKYKCSYVYTKVIIQCIIRLVSGLGCEYFFFTFRFAFLPLERDQLVTTIKRYYNYNRYSYTVMAHVVWYLYLNKFHSYRFFTSFLLIALFMRSNPEKPQTVHIYIHLYIYKLYDLCCVGIDTRTPHGFF